MEVARLSKFFGQKGLEPITETLEDPLGQREVMLALLSSFLLIVIGVQYIKTPFVQLYDVECPVVIVDDWQQKLNI
jgi:hypothetical protein